MIESWHKRLIHVVLAGSVSVNYIISLCWVDLGLIGEGFGFGFSHQCKAFRRPYLIIQLFILGRKKEIKIFANCQICKVILQANIIWDKKKKMITQHTFNFGDLRVFFMQPLIVK